MMENIKKVFDLLESVELREDVVDLEKEYKLNFEKIFNFQNSLEINFNIEKEKKSTFELNSNNYYKHLFSESYYSLLIKKFFDREYKSEPKLRLNKIKNYLEYTINKYENYLISIDFRHDDSESIEAFEQYNIAKTLLRDLSLEENNIEFQHYKDCDITKDYDCEDLNINETKTIKDRIILLWDKLYSKSSLLDESEDGLIRTYLNFIFNPKTTKLDDKNLLFNLNIIDKLMSFNNFKWSFDTDNNYLTKLEIDLNNEWWEDELKNDEFNHNDILSRDLDNNFYISFIRAILNNSDTSSYSNYNSSLYNAINDKNETDFDLFIKTLLNKSEEGSILFLTQDLVKYFSDKEPEFFNNKKIEFVDYWKNRKIYVLNKDSISGLEKLEYEIFILNKGNEFNLNPNKPLVYFNVIETPFMANPILQWYKNFNIKIRLDKSTRLKIDKNIFI